MTYNPVGTLYANKMDLTDKVLNLYKGKNEGHKRRNATMLKPYKPKSRKVRRQNERLDKLYKKQTAKRLRIRRSDLKQYFKIAINTKYSDDEKFDLMKLEIKKLRGFK